MTNILKLIVALCLVLPLVGGCKTFRNLPADGVIAAGSGGGAVAATAIGGPVGAAVWLSVTVASIVVAEEFVRVDPCELVTLPGGTTIPKSNPPWYFNGWYWLRQALVVIACLFLLKLAWSVFLSSEGRFHKNILTGLSLLYQRRFREAWLFILAASGTEHTPEKTTKPTEPQEPKA